MPLSKRSNNTDIICEKILGNLPCAAIIYDSKRIYFLNKQARKILRLSKTSKTDELSLLDFIHPEYLAVHKKSYSSTLKEKNSSVELKIKDKKGNVSDVEIQQNVIDYKGKKVVQAIFNEVSELKKLNEELSESRRILDMFGGHKTDIIFKYDYFPEERYVYISQSVKKVLGYDAERFYKEKHFDWKIIHPDEKRRIAPSWNVFVSRIEKKNTSSIRYVKKDGSIVWLETEYSPIKNEKGKVVSVLGISRDITNLKEKEEELNQKWSNYQELLNESPIAFFIHKKGLCLMCNKEAARILKEKSPDKLIGKYLIDFIIPEQQRTAMERLKLAAKGKAEEYLNYRVSVKGEIIEVELKTVPVKFNGENCVLTIMQDISQKQIYEKEKLRAEIAEEHNKTLISEIALRNKMQEKLIRNEKLLLDQSARLSAVFESGSHLVWTIDTNNRVTSYNKNFKDLIEYKYGVQLQLNKPIHLILPTGQRESYVNYWYPLYQRVFGGQKLQFEKADSDNEGNELYREVFLNPIKNELGEVTEVSCMAHDISENKRKEKEITEKNSKIRAIFENGEHIVWTVNREKAYTSFNNNFKEAIKELFGKAPELYSDMREPDNQYADTDYHDFWHNKYDEAFLGKAVEFVTHRTSIGGKKISRQVFLYPIYNENNEVAEVSGMGFDITDKIANEQKVISQAAKLNAIFEGSSHYIWTVDRGHNLISFNKNYRQLINKVYGVEPEIGMPVNRGKMVSNEAYNSWWDEQYEETFKGSPQVFQTSLNDVNGTSVHLEVFLNPIYENGLVVEVSGIAHDITEKKQNEDRVNQSLKEKEVLLKEVHHRVKNNMQVISSILNLQSSYVKDDYALGLLKESQNRIKTMAYIHESLYQNKTFTSINFSDYISTLTNNILQSYAASVQKVRLFLDVQKIILNLDTSIPAGLIINELVTNSIKHAFSEGKDGIILINLYSKNNTLFLEVSDNGKGFPEEVDFKNTNSLGLQLVNTLIEQLSGNIELTENKYKGTSFHINFPM